MTYESVDKLQKVLAEKVFIYTKDSKKAAGRALGTLVEIINFYLLKSWGFEHSIAIERGLAEYGNPEITHNVEFSLHPILRHQKIILQNPRYPITSSRIFPELDKLNFSLTGFEKTGAILLTNNKVLRNSCIIATGIHSHIVVVLESFNKEDLKIDVLEQYIKPYAMFECKRVGIEEGMRKGPQTIEKAKQGAYVAKSVSCLHKIRLSTGELQGLVFKSDQTIYSKPYYELITEIVNSTDMELLRDFILTVGIVSNHGNWFTSENHNKELKVLAQSYDWLLFLTDKGLSEFITELLLHPKTLLNPARDAFLSSYNEEKTKNQFTKVQMNYEADQVLQKYFKENRVRINKWFNVITPKTGTIENLRMQISAIRNKEWGEIHSL